MQPTTQPTETEPEKDANESQNARVTVREFVEAVATIEARRHTTRRPILRSVVTVGDALNALGSDIRPEEVMEEVRALRAEEAPEAEEPAPSVNTAFNAPHAGEGTATPNPKPYERKRSSRRRSSREKELQQKQIRNIGLGAVGIVLIGMLIFALITQANNGTNLPVTQTEKPVAFAVSEDTVVTVNGVDTTLRKVSDNIPVTIPTVSLGKVIPLDKSNVLGENSGTINSDEVPWQIIKHDGAVYLQGWLERKTDREVFRASDNPILIHNSRDSTGSKTAVPLSIRTDAKNLHVTLGVDGKSIAVSGINPDTDLYSK